MSTILLHASSRSNGNTTVIADYLAGALGCPAIDLSTHDIAYYSYQADYPDSDQFISIIDQAIAYDNWLLITPVYWYTMSAQMKTFLDRLSDLLSDHQYPRQLLAGKKLWVICCGSDPDPVPHFFTPFRLSADYLDMKYGGELHAWLGRVPEMKPEVRILLDAFIEGLKNEV